MITSMNAVLCGGVFVIFLGSIKFLINKIFGTLEYNNIEEDSQKGIGEKINLVLLGVELIALFLSMLALQNFKRFRGEDRFDELLNESKTALRQANEVLEKWQNQSLPSVYSYLDNTETENMNPIKVEVPILHMAIVDTITRNRNQQERGDSVDTTSIVDSAVLSLTSLIDGDDGSINDATEAVKDQEDNLNDLADQRDDKSLDSNYTHLNLNRYLWDVEEENSDGIS